MLKRVLWHFICTYICTHIGTICNNVAKIIYIILHFVLLIVVFLCKQNTNDTLNHLPEVPISAIREHLTARG